MKWSLKIWKILIVQSLFLWVGNAFTAECACNAFYTYSKAEHCYGDPEQGGTLASITYWVQTPAQAEVLCTNFARLTNQPSSRCARYQLTHHTNFKLNVSSAVQIVVPDIYSMIVPVSSEIQPSESCTQPFVEMVELKPSPTAGWWNPETACQQPFCPQSTVEPNSIPNDLKRFANGNQLVCNIAKCPTCTCQVFTGVCQCPEMFTGASCNFFKPEWCCQPPLEWSVSALYGQKTCPVCGGFANVSQGFEACLSVNNQPPTCSKCRPDKNALEIIQRLPALAGPRCSQSACANGQGCENGLDNTCLTVCKTRSTNVEKWCYQCTHGECEPSQKAVCKCEQTRGDKFFVGPRCEIRGHGSPDFTSSSVENGQFQGGHCQTIPTTQIETWNLGYNQPNPYVCAGHGTCTVPSVACSCDPGFLQQTRCFQANVCPFVCPTDRADCTPFPNSNYICACKLPFFSSSLLKADSTVANLSQVCQTNGCSGSFELDGNVIGQAVWDPSKQVCKCPHNVSTGSDGPVVHSEWMEQRGENKQGRVGCRIQCPFWDGKECGDGFLARCSNPFEWLDPLTNLRELPKLTCNCDLDITSAGQRLPKRISNSYGSCEIYCQHGEDVWNERPPYNHQGCNCETGRRVVGSDVINEPLWIGPRCNVSRCMYGSTWNPNEQRCDCSKAVPPHNLNILKEDIWCQFGGCSPPFIWNGHNCVCPEGLILVGGNCQPPCNAHTGRVDENNVCVCNTLYTGPSCEQTLCEHGANVAFSIEKGGVYCNCSSPLWSGRYCNLTSCQSPFGELNHAKTFCLCESPLLSGPTCTITTQKCGGPNLGQAVFEQGEWSCKCNNYVPTLNDGTCGCPAPQMELENCNHDEDDQDPRCVFQTAVPENLQTLRSALPFRKRCVCALGFATTLNEHNIPTCTPLECDPAGRVLEPPRFERINGNSKCRCKPGWTGMTCNVFDAFQRCGNGTRTIAGTCQCDEFALLQTDPVLGDYCALDCQHNGVYQIVSSSCLCLHPWTGPLCQFHSMEISSSSTGGISPFPDEHGEAEDWSNPLAKIVYDNLVRPKPSVGDINAWTFVMLLVLCGLWIGGLVRSSMDFDVETRQSTAARMVYKLL